ncbi:hypothetical protein BH18ACI4_BH18ACI4_01510 [soil metagenome]
MSPSIKIVIPSFVVALALSILARKFLTGKFSESVVEGISFWLLFLALYPAIMYFSRKEREKPKVRYSFLRHVLGATAGVVIVFVINKLLL